MRLAVALLAVIACRPPGYGKPADVDAGGGGDDVDAPVAHPDATAAATCPHMFRLDGHGSAQSVWLSGDFVQWAATPAAGAIAFTLDAGGGWNGSYAFTAGPHQYKLIIDGTDWITDPTNPSTVDDGMGHTNSLYTCTP